MGVTDTVRALVMLYLIFVIFTIGGAILIAIMVRTEPMLVPTITSTEMLEEYLQWREILGIVWQWTAYSLSVIMTYILLTGGIRVASNIYEVIRRRNAGEGVY